MSLRIIVRFDDAGMAANVGGSVYTEFKTFDVDAREVEEFLAKHNGSLQHAHIVGVEVFKARNGEDNG